MSSATATAEQPLPSEQEQALPNKFGYPEFAGFAGEKLMRRIVKAILPRALYIVWETFEEEHAYDNECFLSLVNVAKDDRRTQRTIDRNIATLMSRGLLAMRPGYKFFRNPDGSLRKKGVMIKDFSGLYALAHEYYLWMTEDPDYQAPNWEGVELVRYDPRLVAKLCRFEDYRRLLDRQRDPIFLRVQADPRFASQEPPLEGTGQQDAEDAEEQLSGQNPTKLTSKLSPELAANLSKERINENAYKDSLNGDSFDSDEAPETRGEAGAHSNMDNELAARGYTKQVRGDKTGTHSANETETNPVPPSPKNVPPAPGKTRVSDENAPEVQSARGAMTAFGIVPGQPARPQAKELPPPTKHPLARSFVHEIAGLFGDQNVKGSKTDVERRIEDFELDQPLDVLRCLVRAYVVARDTPDEEVHRRRPDGGPNRMPLFTRMFERFAQALGPGSSWQYTYQQMFEAIAADGRLELWVSEHQAELAGEVSDQAEDSQPSLTFVEELTEEEAGEAGEEPEEMFTEEDEEAGEEQCQEEISDPAVVGGWAEWDVALAHGERMLQAIVDANYIGVGAALRERDGRYYVVYQVLADAKSEQVVDELVLSDETQIEGLIRRAQLGRL